MDNSGVCSICGANYVIRNGRKQCPACGVLAPEEQTNEEQAMLFHAEQSIRLAEFEHAEQLFTDLVEKFPNEFAGYWGRVRAKFGIKFETVDGKAVPTCFASMRSIFDEKDYETALRYADSESRSLMEKYAASLEDLRKRYEEVSKKVKPYDVFICYKKNEITGAPTPESKWGRDLYEELTHECHLNVFFAEKSLQGSNEEWEPQIYAALQSAKIMFVLASSKEHLEAIWVKNEWKRFLVLQKENPEKVLRTICGNLPISDLPVELRKTQVIDHDDKDCFKNARESAVNACGKSASAKKKKTEMPDLTPDLSIKFEKVYQSTFEAFDFIRESEPQASFEWITEWRRKVDLFLQYALLQVGAADKNLSEVEYSLISSVQQEDSLILFAKGKGLQIESEDLTTADVKDIELLLQALSPDMNEICSDIETEFSKLSAVSANKHLHNIKEYTAKMISALAHSDGIAESHEMNSDKHLERLLRDLKLIVECKKQAEKDDIAQQKYQKKKSCPAYVKKILFHACYFAVMALTIAIGILFVNRSLAKTIVIAAPAFLLAVDLFIIIVPKKVRLKMIKPIVIICCIVAVFIGGYFIISKLAGKTHLRYQETADGYIVYASSNYQCPASLTIPGTYNDKPVVEIAAGAFADQEGLAELIIPLTIKRIAEGAFANCTNLKTFSFSAGVGSPQLAEIQNNAFSGCSALADFPAVSGLTIIGDRAFAETAISLITIPPAVDTIGDRAFDGCTALENIVFLGFKEEKTSWSSSWKAGCSANIHTAIVCSSQDNIVPATYILADMAFTYSVPTKAGYHFLGWCLGEIQVTDSNGKSLEGITLSDSCMLAPIWEANTNTIIFSANGGDGEMSELTGVTGETLTLPICTFQRSGYDFLGWSTSTANQVVFEDEANYQVTTESSTTLFAVWLKNTSSVSLTVANGKRNATITNSKKTTETISPAFSVSRLRDYGYNAFQVTITYQCKEIDDGYQNLTIQSSSGSVIHKYQNDHGEDTCDTEWGSYTINFTLSFNDVSNDGSFVLEWSAGGWFGNDWELGDTKVDIRAITQ